MKFSIFLAMLIFALLDYTRAGSEKKISDSLDEVNGKVSEVLNKVKQPVGDFMKDTYDKIKPPVETVGGFIKDTYETVRDKVKPSVESVGRTIKGAYKNAQEKIIGSEN